MPRVGFEPAFQKFDRSRTINDIDSKFSIIVVIQVIKGLIQNLHYRNYYHNSWTSAIDISICDSTALCWVAFSVSWSFTQMVGHLGRGISPSQGRYLHTGQHKHRTNVHKHPCLKWDSNLQSELLSERRQFMLQSYCDRRSRCVQSCNL
jgi:hypothetical protein